MTPRVLFFFSFSVRILDRSLRSWRHLKHNHRGVPLSLLLNAQNKHEDKSCQDSFGIYDNYTGG